jgi:hypothetical protein
MTTVTEELALLIQRYGHGTYPIDPTDTGGSIFLHAAPDGPDEVITVSRPAGADSESLQGYDTVSFQVRVRGPRHDSGAAEELAQAIYDDLHGLRSMPLPGGTWLVHLLAMGAGPGYMGVDTHQRTEFSLNFRAELRRITRNRQ